MPSKVILLLLCSAPHGFESLNSQNSWNSGVLGLDSISEIIESSQAVSIVHLGLQLAPEKGI